MGRILSSDSRRLPRKLLIEALQYVQAKHTALDLGAGDLVDSKYLLDLGFKVVALDASPDSEKFSHAITSPNFTFIRSTYDTYTFPRDSYDLATAQLALPFNPPKSFTRVFNDLKKFLKTEGVFVGHFFGTRDEWNTPQSAMTFHTKTYLEKLLVGMEILVLREIEEDKKLRQAQ